MSYTEIKSSIAMEANTKKQLSVFAQAQRQEKVNRLVSKISSFVKDRFSKIGNLTVIEAEDSLTEIDDGVFSGNVIASIIIDKKPIKINVQVKANNLSTLESVDQVAAIIEKTPSDADNAVAAIANEMNTLKTQAAEDELSRQAIQADINNGLPKAEAEMKHYGYEIQKEAKPKEFIMSDTEGPTGLGSKFPNASVELDKCSIGSLKIGDTLDIGGFKYTYAEDTVSLDGSTGLRAIFRLIV